MLHINSQGYTIWFFFPSVLGEVLSVFHFFSGSFWLLVLFLVVVGFSLLVINS